MSGRWVRRQTARVAPTNVARGAKTSLLELGRRVSESVEEGKRAMAEKEQELRSDRDA